jgi:diacylglycerol O-acyltransferase
VADIADRRMTDAEGLMWRLETDPVLSSSFGTVTLLDRPADLERLRRRMDRAVVLVPHLRQRVQDRPFGLPPVWVDVPDVDLTHHVRQVRVPAPGGLRQVLDLATELLAAPFDVSRPLWEFLVVDGLADGRGALVQKMHHTLTDGENGLKLSMQFLDLERDAPELPPLTPEQLAAATPEPPPTTADAVVEAVGNGVRLGTRVLRGATTLLLDPTRLASLGEGLTKQVRGTVNTLATTERARSTLWATKSLDRRIEALRVPLDPVKEAAHEFGGTLNMAFLTAAAAAAGAYHRELGAPVDTLRASMAISTRSKESGANAFTLARLTVPTSEMSPAERFEQIVAAADGARAEARKNASLESLAVIAAALPTSLIVQLAKQQTGTVDFATSNLRAAPFPLHLAGGRILANYPVGPLVGVAFNLTLLSYCGSLDMGLHVDTAAVSDPPRLRSLLEESFQDLVDAAQAKRGRAKKTAARSTKKKSAGKTTKTTKAAKAAKAAKASGKQRGVKSAKAS